MPFIDITGLQTLEEVVRDLHQRGVNVMLSGANARVEAKLRKAGIVELVGEQNHFKAFDDALVAAQARVCAPATSTTGQQIAVEDPVATMRETNRE